LRELKQDGQRKRLTQSLHNRRHYHAGEDLTGVIGSGQDDRDTSEARVSAHDCEQAIGSTPRQLQIEDQS
jgi:hypothetical protein